MYNERKSLTEYERNTNFRVMFKDHFKTILIIQTDTLEVVDRLKINENIKIDRDSKILSFYQ